jgi:hypothetical protein
MFTEMVSLLKRGEIIDLKLLRNRFDLALVKKIGVINTPYSFWSSDPKINPLTKELLWASILLEDKENFNLLLGVIATEANEKRMASGLETEVTENENGYKNITGKLINEFLELAPTDNFRKSLPVKVENTAN